MLTIFLRAGRRSDEEQRVLGAALAAMAVATKQKDTKAAATGVKLTPDTGTNFVPHVLLHTNCVRSPPATALRTNCQDRIYAFRVASFDP